MYFNDIITYYVAAIKLVDLLWSIDINIDINDKRKYEKYFAKVGTYIFYAMLCKIFFNKDEMHGKNVQ